jgi:hypothetical protein
MSTLMPGHAPLKFHPLANLFPMLSERETDDLGADMRDNGQVETVKLHRGMILDGRNRYTAGVKVGLAIRAEVFEGTDRDALNWVISKNLKRRHLTESQRAMVAAKLATLRLGDNQHSQPAPIGAPGLDFGGEAEPPPQDPVAIVSQSEAGDLMNVSRRSVQRATTVVEQGVPQLQEAVAQDQIAVSVAEKIARLPEAEQPAAVEKALPKGNRAIMSSRQEPDDSLDFFPTPPWATRALVERVLPHIDPLWRLDKQSAWEPACGEGHMAEVLREYFGAMLATDIFDYGYGDRVLDFLSDLEVVDIPADFIITNPPFGEKGEAFVLQALQRARFGVGMFVRLQWLETVGRYEKIFRDRPPTLIAFFAERVNLCKGRWEPEGGTATAYIWLVWIKGMEPRAAFWIPPGCREALTRPDDAERFTQHPVAKRRPPVETAEDEAA